MPKQYKALKVGRLVVSRAEWSRPVVRRSKAASYALGLRISGLKLGPVFVGWVAH